MVTGITLAPLALEQTTFNVGDTVRVTVSFNYTVGVNKTVRLMAGPYYSNLLGKHLVSSCVGDADVALVPSSTPAAQTATVDFILIPKANSGIENGTYGLRVWIEDTNAVAEQDDVIIVTGNTGSSDMFSSMMPMIMMLMMMGMIMPMTQQMGQGAEEE